MSYRLFFLVYISILMAFFYRSIPDHILFPQISDMLTVTNSNVKNTV